MNWDYFKLLKKQEEEKKSNAVKVVFITLGVVAAIAAALAVLYTIFKKYFTITIECDDCDCDCDLDECCDTEPLCCCEDEDESAASEA